MNLNTVKRDEKQSFYNDLIISIVIILIVIRNTKTEFGKGIFQKVLTGGGCFSSFRVGGFTVNYLTAASS